MRKQKDKARIRARLSALVGKPYLVQGEMEGYSRSQLRLYSLTANRKIIASWQKISFKTDDH